MKIALYIGAGLIITVHLLGLFSAREIHTEIEINASANRVWEILVKFDEYPDWNPFIREISGELSEGSRLSVSIQPVDSDPMDFQPTLIKAEKNDELRWIGRVLIPGIFDGEHYFRIEKISEEKVSLIHGENFSGILVPLLWGSMESGTKQGFKAMNEALKNKVEAPVQQTAK